MSYKAVVPHIGSLFHPLAVGTFGNILVEGSGELERGQQCLKINDKNKGKNPFDMRNTAITINKPESSPAVLWLGCWAFIAEGLGSIPGQGTKIHRWHWCCQ